MFRVLSILATALGELFRPRSRLGRAIAPVILIKIAVLVTARILWFGPMTHEVAPTDVATQLIAAPASGEPRGDIR